MADESTLEGQVTPGGSQLPVSLGKRRGVLRVVTQPNGSVSLEFVAEDSAKKKVVSVSRWRPLVVSGSRLQGGGHWFYAKDPAAAAEFAAGLPAQFVQKIWAGAPQAAHRRVPTARERTVDTWASTLGVARTVAAGAWALIALSGVGGLLIAVQRDPDCRAFRSSCALLDEYPLLVTGVLTGMFGVFNGLVVLMVASYVRARAQHATLLLE